MPPTITIPPPRRTELILRPLGREGQYVAKDPVSGSYFNLGEQEFFLLEQLDGIQSVDAICRAFHQRFGEAITEADLNGFLELAQSQNFLQTNVPSVADRETRADIHLAPTHQGTETRPYPTTQPISAAPAPPTNSASDVQEQFLLERVSRGESPEQICAAYERRFGEPLPRADLVLFTEMARMQGYLPNNNHSTVSTTPGSTVAFGAPQPLNSAPLSAPAAPLVRAPLPSIQSAPPSPASPPQKSATSGRNLQSILCWRRSLFDPDRLFNVLAPLLWFIWTPTFVVLSLCGILAAAAVFWTNRTDIAGQLSTAFTWQTAALVWVTLLIATTCHEFAHGLTCKRYGGEVHEVGFLLMFFMPCFYCNVSDAWLIPEKSKRLWVTLAGGYCDLCSWAIAVFAWRLTLPGTLPNHIAWVVITVLGGRIIFNFNPFLKLDGYYLLSDAVECPNMQQRAYEYFKGHMRWLLWGAPRPAPERKGKFLLTYGTISWIFAIAFLSLMLGGLVTYLWPYVGWFAVAIVAVLAIVVVPGLLGGLVKGELKEMLLKRRRWTAFWGVGATSVVLILLAPYTDRSSGPFQVRSVHRVELRARVAGFLHVVNFDEGDHVPAGSVLAVIEVPDLESKLLQKRAEIREDEAKLALLEAGTRNEEKSEQRKRVERLQRWRDQGAEDLERSRKILAADLNRLDAQIAQSHKEIEFAEGSRERARKLKGLKSISDEEIEAAERKYTTAVSQLAQEEAQRRARAAQSTTEAETELSRREKELADARSSLALLEVGPRMEDVDAAKAKLIRLQEELHYLESIQQRVAITCPTAGLVLTPRVREKIGQYIREGEVVAVVEDPASLEAEITLTEQDVSRVAPGQEVLLMSRTAPFKPITTHLDRVAPSTAAHYDASTATTAHTDTAGNVTVYCRLENADPNLRSGMSGYARVYCGKRRIGEIVADRVLRYLRTEFWW